MSEKAEIVVKMCGFTRQEDAVLAVELGVDAIGMLFYPGSPRYVGLSQAQAVAAAARGKASLVGLFVDAEEEFVRQVLANVPLDILQFHGAETPVYCESFGLSYWKTLRAKEPAQLPSQAAAYESADGTLIDTWHPTKAGGTGETFDWSMLDGLKLHQHLVLAGGLNPDNVAQAIAEVRPWAVDVCSGVEESPGIKSYGRMRAFMQAAGR